VPHAFACNSRRESTFFNEEAKVPDVLVRLATDGMLRKSMVRGDGPPHAIVLVPMKPPAPPSSNFLTHDWKRGEQPFDRYRGLIANYIDWIGT